MNLIVQCVCTKSHSPCFFKETDSNNSVKLILIPLFWELNEEVKKQGNSLQLEELKVNFFRGNC